MNDLIQLDRVSLWPGGGSLSQNIPAGVQVVIVRDSDPDGSRLLRVMVGLERPTEGTVTLRGRIGIPGTGLNRRTRLQSMARLAAGGSVQRVTDVLSATGLWEVRQSLLGQLSPNQLAAAELIPVLLGTEEVVVLDGHLDQLDPWALSSVREWLREDRRRGRMMLIASHRPDQVAEADAVIVLRASRIRFAGTLPDLLRRAGGYSFVIETNDQPGVRALTAPFDVSVVAREDGFHLEANEGQALAVHLLREGYGDVRMTVVRPPTVEEALLRI